MVIDVNNPVYQSRFSVIWHAGSWIFIRYSVDLELQSIPLSGGRLDFSFSLLPLLLSFPNVALLFIMPPASVISPPLFILLPRTVYWSGRSWFCVCVCVMCAFYCCAVYFAAQNCVLIWQKLVLCMCVHVRCVHVFVVQISRKQVVWSLFKTIMFKSLVSTRCSALHRAVIQLHRLWLQKSCTLQEKLFHSEYLVVDSITVLEVLQAHAYPLTKL